MHVEAKFWHNSQKVLFAHENIWMFILVTLGAVTSGHYSGFFLVISDIFFGWILHHHYIGHCHNHKKASMLEYTPHKRGNKIQKSQSIRGWAREQWKFSGETYPEKSGRRHCPQPVFGAISREYFSTCCVARGTDSMNVLIFCLLN